MNPVDAALRAVSETRRLLEHLLRSSESFDYVEARATLSELRRKARQLARLQAGMQRRQLQNTPDICRPDFGAVSNKSPGLAPAAPNDIAGEPVG